jgi:hypothetical protein
VSCGHLSERNQVLPPLLEMPADPVAGRPGDLPVR